MIVSKPITFSYDILEDGSVAECQVRNIDGQERLRQAPRTLPTSFAERWMKRRYPPGVRVKTEINFGTPTSNDEPSRSPFRWHLICGATSAEGAPQSVATAAATASRPLVADPRQRTSQKPAITTVGAIQNGSECRASSTGATRWTASAIPPRSPMRSYQPTARPTHTSLDLRWAGRVLMRNHSFGLWILFSTWVVACDDATVKDEMAANPRFPSRWPQTTARTRFAKKLPGSRWKFNAAEAETSRST